MPILEASEVVKLYKQPDSVVYAVNHAGIKVEDGEFVAIIGASAAANLRFCRSAQVLTTPQAGRW